MTIIPQRIGDQPGVTDQSSFVALLHDKCQRIERHNSRPGRCKKSRHRLNLRIVEHLSPPSHLKHHRIEIVFLQIIKDIDQFPFLHVDICSVTRPIQSVVSSQPDRSHLRRRRSGRKQLYRSGKKQNQ